MDRRRRARVGVPPLLPPPRPQRCDRAAGDPARHQRSHHPPEQRSSSSESAAGRTPAGSSRALRRRGGGERRRHGFRATGSRCAPLLAPLLAPPSAPRVLPLLLLAPPRSIFVSVPELWLSDARSPPPLLSRAREHSAGARAATTDSSYLRRAHLGEGRAANATSRLGASWRRGCSSLVACRGHAAAHSIRNGRLAARLQRLPGSGDAETAATRRAKRARLRACDGGVAASRLAGRHFLHDGRVLRPLRPRRAAAPRGAAAAAALRRKRAPLRRLPRPGWISRLASRRRALAGRWRWWRGRRRGAGARARALQRLRRRPPRAADAQIRQAAVLQRRARGGRRGGGRRRRRRRRRRPQARRRYPPPAFAAIAAMLARQPRA